MATVLDSAASEGGALRPPADGAGAPGGGRPDAGPEAGSEGGTAAAAVAVKKAAADAEGAAAEGGGGAELAGGEAGKGAAPEEKERETWNSRAEFLLSLVGYAVGISNLWRFPALAFKHGGGSFLIPYLFAMVVMGIPLFLAEVALGQIFKKGTYYSLVAIHPRLRGVGIAGIVISFIVSVYYNVIIAWCAVYVVASFMSPLPWKGDTEAYWFDTVLSQSSGFADGDGISWHLAGALIFSWLLVFGALRGGVKTSGKVVWVTATVPYLLLVILFFRCVTLEGAGAGIEFYLTPDWDQLRDPSVWATAGSQIYYSLGVGLGSLTAFGSYTDAATARSVVSDTVTIACLNSGTSIFAGFGVFSLLGHLAWERGVSVEDVVASGEGLAFIVYPEVLASLPASNFFALMFFVMLLFLGVDSQFAIVEVTMTALKDYGLRVPETWALAAMCTASLLLGLPFISGAGIFWFEMVDTYAALISMFLCGAGYCVAVAWVYGVERFAADILRVTGKKVHPIFLFMWKWLTPGFCLTLVIVEVVSEGTDPLEIETPDGRGITTGARLVGHLCYLIPAACIVYCALVVPPELRQQWGAEGAPVRMEGVEVELSASASAAAPVAKPESAEDEVMSQ